MSGNSQDRRKFDRAVERAAGNRHHGRDYLLAAFGLLVEAFAVIMGIIPLTMGAGVLFYFALESYTRQWRSNTQFNSKWLHLTSLVLLCVLTTGAGYGIQGLVASRRPSVPSPIELVLDNCMYTDFPMVVPRGTTVHILRVNPAILKRAPRNTNIAGLFDVTAPVDHDRIWPSDKEAPAMPEHSLRGPVMSGNAPAMRCSITKRGNAAVDSVIVPLQFAGLGQTFNLLIDPLEPEDKFTFYLVNACYTDLQPDAYFFGSATTLFANFPKTATLHVLGETNWRRVPVKLTFRENSPELIVLLPAYRHWQDLPPC